MANAIVDEISTYHLIEGGYNTCTYGNPGRILKWSLFHADDNSTKAGISVSYLRLTETVFVMVLPPTSFTDTVTKSRDAERTRIERTYFDPLLVSEKRLPLLRRAETEERDVVEVTMQDSAIRYRLPTLVDLADSEVIVGT